MIPVVWTLAIFVTVAYVVHRLVRRLTRRLPPGPWGLPLLGCWTFISRSSSKDYFHLIRKYGKIFGFYQGSRYVVVLNRFSDIKEAYNKEEFLDRPPGWFSVSELYDNLANMNGWEWKETRKFTMSALRNLGVGKNKVEEAVKDEITSFVANLDKTSPNTEVNVFDSIYIHLLNIVFAITCGSTFQEDEFVKIISDYSTEMYHIVIDNQRLVFFPYLRPLLKIKNAIMPRPRAAIQNMETYFGKEIRNHENQFDESNHQENYMDIYLNDIKKNTSKRTSLTLPNLSGNAQMMIFVASDTSRLALSWTLLSLAEHQDCQENMYREIMEVAGKERSPSWSEKDSLPYTTAFIMEVARYRTIAPSADPHWCSKEATIGGYTIPKDSIVMANIKAVHMDKDLWGDPDHFRPERFLSQDSKKVVAPEYWIPFLTGKRSCPGERLASMNLFLFVTSLVQKYHVTPPSSGLSMAEHEFLLLFPVKPVIGFQARN